MAYVVRVENLKKVYKIPVKEVGLKAAKEFL